MNSINLLATRIVEVGLQVLVARGAGMRAEQPALQQRDRPVATLDRVSLAPLSLGLDDRLMRPRGEARLAVCYFRMACDTASLATT